MCEDPCNDSVTGPIVTDTTINVNNIASMINVGGEVEVYKNATVNPFELRTLKKGTEGNTIGDYGLQLVQQAETIDIAYNPLTTNTIWVDQEFGDDNTGQIKHQKLKFQTIGAAVAANPGSYTIIIAPGTYNETLPLTANGSILVGIGAVKINSVNAFVSDSSFSCIGRGIVWIDTNDSGNSYIRFNVFDIGHIDINQQVNASSVIITGLPQIQTSDFTELRCIEFIMSGYASALTFRLENMHLNCSTFTIPGTITTRNCYITCKKGSVDRLEYINYIEADHLNCGTLVNPKNINVKYFTGAFEFTGTTNPLGGIYNGGAIINIQELYYTPEGGIYPTYVSFFSFVNQDINAYDVIININKMTYIANSYHYFVTSTDSALGYMYRSHLKINIDNLYYTNTHDYALETMLFMSSDSLFSLNIGSMYKQSTYAFSKLICVDTDNTSTVAIKGNFEAGPNFLNLTSVKNIEIEGKLITTLLNGNYLIRINSGETLAQLSKAYFSNLEIYNDSGINSNCEIVLNSLDVLRKYIFKNVKIWASNNAAANAPIGTAALSSVDIYNVGGVTSNKVFPTAHVTYGTVVNLSTSFPLVTEVLMY